MGKKNKAKKNDTRFNDSSTNGSFGSNYQTEYRRRPHESYRNNGRFPRYGKYHHQPYKFKRGKNKNWRNKSRPSSPVLGTQEYMEKKIEQTSAIIMRHLLNPDAVLPVQAEAEKQNDEDPQITDSQRQEKECEIEGQSAIQNSNKTKRKLTSDQVEDIHMKIMCHISNLNDGRKKNLINSSNSGYDSTIQHFVTQQRLEISRALRNMCSSNQTEESNDLINSMIPDIGIKIEDLSADVIEKLSQTFGCDFNVESLGDYENNSYPPYRSTFEVAERHDKFHGIPCDGSREPNSNETSCIPTRFECMQDIKKQTSTTGVEPANKKQGFEEMLKKFLGLPKDLHSRPDLKKRKSSQRQSWSKEESVIVQTYFGKHIIKKITPKKHEVEEFKKKLASFRDRNWIVIKAHIYNCYERK